MTENPHISLSVFDALKFDIYVKYFEGVEIEYCIVFRFIKQQFLNFIRCEIIMREKSC